MWYAVIFLSIISWMISSILFIYRQVLTTTYQQQCSKNGPGKQCNKICVYKNLVQVYYPQELGKLIVSKNNLEGLQTSVTITVIFSFVKEITLSFSDFQSTRNLHTQKLAKKFFHSLIKEQVNHMYSNTKKDINTFCHFLFQQIQHKCHNIWFS